MCGSLHSIRIREEWTIIDSNKKNETLCDSRTKERRTVFIEGSLRSNRDIFTQDLSDIDAKESGKWYNFT